MRRRALLLVLPPLLLAACRSSRAAPPTVRAAAARPTPRPTPTPYGSGGLGLFRDEWEARHGEGRPTGALVSYRGGRLAAAFANGLVWYLERAWGAATPVPLPTARDESRTLMPSDARLVRSYETRNLRKVDLYVSPSLVERFRSAAESADPIDPWRGAEPGTLIVYYHERGEEVAGLVMSTGNNP